jgi:hypothetical protein
MNRNVTKGLIVGIAIAAIILYQYFKRENEALEKSYNEQLQALQQQDSDNAKKNEEFVQLDEDCELIGQFKGALNHFVGYDLYDSANIYDLALKTDLEIILANTTHFYDENMGLRKSFLYDINIAVANAIDSDIPPRTFNYEYTSGVISLGDKGNDVTTLQALVNYLYAKVDYTERLDENGTYDKPTSVSVIKLFTGATAMIDSTKGAIAKEFVDNFTTIINNLKTI